ncbi:MAG: TonB-dependent receptor, partial [Chloroflexia bacterium]|nr:TonB-dependent receptor [Chloroflexia bacterium]
MNFTKKITDRITVGGMGNYIKTDTKGRNSTGYNDNIMGSFRQWWQTNVDVKQMKDAYFSTGRNITWNYAATDNLSPIYWDNPYWTRHENYASDGRNRFIGNITLNYELLDWLNIFGRVSVDTYTELQEERRRNGSVASAFGIGEGNDGSLRRSNATSGYQRKDITFNEYNYDIMLNYKYDLSDKLNIAGVIGTNIRRTNFDWTVAATNGGTGVEGLYAIQNSQNPVPFPKEINQKVGVNGIYGSVSLGYDGFLFLDGTLRRDHSSTLPKDNSVYYYPSVATSFVFNKFIPGDILSHGKLRLNYAQVGNSPGFDQIFDTYNIAMPLGSAMTSVADTKKNPELKPETTTSLEAGLELNFLENRVRFDLAFYKTNSVDQILPVSVSSYNRGTFFKVINAGEIENKGVELMLAGTPIKTNDFSWDISVNWAKNKNEVVSLTEGLDNLQLGTFQQGVTLNAKPGQPYGNIQGTDFTYLNGQKIVNQDNGQYVSTSTSDEVIGNVQPDWTGGISNTFRYKNISLSFLIDIQSGGDIWSLDMAYGLATGLYEETAFTNDLGNPVRNPLVFNQYDSDGVGIPSGGYTSESGGFINPGVNPDGSPNSTRINANRYGAFGYRRGLPNAAFIYDASYVKLRELVISYNFPSKWFQNNFLT